MLCLGEQVCRACMSAVLTLHAACGWRVDGTGKKEGVHPVRSWAHLIVHIFREFLIQIDRCVGIARSNFLFIKLTLNCGVLSVCLF